MSEITHADEPVGGATLGGRLRSLRERRGLSLHALARQIDISASSLSALETDQGGVSLQRLQLVTEALGVRITDVLMGDELRLHHGGGEPEIVRGWPSSGAAVERGRGVTYQLLGNGRGHSIQPYMISFAPGAGYLDDRIGHPGEEFAYVLIGLIEIVIDDETHTLAQGDAIRFNPARPHAFRNGSTRGVAVVIGAATPPW